MSQKKGVTYADRQHAAEGRRRSLATDGTAPAAAEFVLPKPDNHRQPGQEWGVLSYCAPDNARVKCKKVAIKFSGGFPSEDAASKAAEIIRNEDPRFDVHVFPLYTWGMVPISEDVKPLVRKEYLDKYMTSVMLGQQASLIQSRKEMDERIAKARAESEREMRKKLGPDYVPAASAKPDVVKQYEEESQKRAVQTRDMSFTQKELVESFAKYMSSGSGAKIDPAAAGNFIRFMEAQKVAEATLAANPESDTVAVSIPDSGPAVAAEPPSSSVVDAAPQQ